MTHKTFADAIFEAEKHGQHALKHAALSGLEGPELKLAMEALNPYRVFNIKKFDKPKVFANDDPDYSLFLKLLDQLVTRELSGNAAKAAVTAILGSYTERTATVLQRVLLKDLKCGAGVSVFKKLYPLHADDFFPEFELMLAAKIDEKPEVVRKTDVLLTPGILEKKYKLRFPMIAEAKYDGKRLLAYVNGGRVEYLTRSGNKAEWCDGLFDAELIRIEQLLGYPFVLDGEVLGRSFQETASASGSDADALEARRHCKFFAFDWMSLSVWQNRSATSPQHRRSAEVLGFITTLGLTKITKSKSKTVYSIADLKAFYAEVLKDGVNADGTINGLGEGLIIKNHDGLYEWDRSKNWFKWKPVLDLDLEIVGFYEGDAGKKNEGKLGGMIMRGRDENDRPIFTHCGGFKVTDPDTKKFIDEKAAAEGLNLKTMNRDQWFRAYVWSHQAEFLGQTAMIECQELSLADGATEWAARFPQFCHIRHDKVTVK
jgi:DNA ligase-1